MHSYGCRTPDEEVTSEIQEDELEVQEQVLNTARGKAEVEVQDLYAFLGQLSPVLLAVVGVAADYYALHCFTRYGSPPTCNAVSFYCALTPVHNIIAATISSTSLMVAKGARWFRWPLPPRPGCTTCG